MFLESPEGFLTFVFGVQNSCFGEPRRFPDIWFWCPKLMFLETPQDFLTFVFGAQNSCFWTAQKVSWHFVLISKTHVFGESRRFPDICFWCRPKNHIFGEPRRFPDICCWCPKLIFWESPDGFLTFVFGAQNSCFWRAQKVSWHLFLVPRTHIFGQPGRCPGIWFWCPKLMFLESPQDFLTFTFGAQNSWCWRAQKVSCHLFLVPKTHVFGERRRFPDICFWCPKLTFLESPEGFLTFVVGAQNSCSWRAQKVSWHLFLVPKTHVFGEPRRFPDICF